MSAKFAWQFIKIGCQKFWLKNKPGGPKASFPHPVTQHLKIVKEKNLVKEERKLIEDGFGIYLRPT